MSTQLTAEGTTILEAVRKLAPLLRENAAAGEERRWVTEESLAALGEAGVWRMAVPARFGGLDLPVADQVAVLAEVGTTDGSLVWVASVYVAETWCCQRFDERAQAEIFAGGQAMVAGTVTPSGVLTPVAGGYRLNGAWRFNTGCRGAEWDIVFARLEDGGANGGTADGAEPEVLAMVVPVAELSVADDWRVSAAVATGSSTVTATDVFVPEHRTMPMAAVLSGGSPATETMAANHRNYPLLPYISAHSAATFLGLARGVLEQFIERARGRAITYTPWEDQSRYPVAQVHVGQAANLIAAADGLVDKATDILQRRADAGEPLTPDETVAVHGHSTYAADLCRQAADLLFRDCGANVIRSDVAIQRMHRDIQGLANHGAMSLTPKMEAHGRVLLGLDAGSAFV